MTDKLRCCFPRLKLSQCGSGWGTKTSSTCKMDTVKRSTSGVYWCQSEQRDSSNTVNITVTSKIHKTAKQALRIVSLLLSVPAHFTWNSNHRFGLKFNTCDSYVICKCWLLHKIYLKQAESKCKCIIKHKKDNTNVFLQRLRDILMIH